MLNFIMHSSDNYDLYALGNARILVDRVTLRVVFYYNDKVVLI